MEQLSYRLYPDPKTARDDYDRFMINIQVEPIVGYEHPMVRLFDLSDVESLCYNLNSIPGIRTAGATEVVVRVCAVEINIVLESNLVDDYIYDYIKETVFDSISGHWADWARDYSPLRVTSIKVQKLITWDVK